MSNKAQPPAKSNCLWYQDTRNPTEKNPPPHFSTFQLSQEEKVFATPTHMHQAPLPPLLIPRTHTLTPEPVASTYAIIMSVY